MPNKKLLTIFLILLIIILLIFTIVYLIQKSKIPKDQTTQPTPKPTEETTEPKQISPLKQVTLSTDKQIYNPDEEIKVIGIIRNPFPETKNWTVVYYFMSQDEKSFSALGQTRKLKLKPGQTEKVEFTSVVSQNLPPGNYKVKLEILEQDQVISAKSKIIEIQGTNKELTAQAQICQDANCREEKVVFLQNENIYIKVDSDVFNLNITGKIKYPNQEELQDLSFRNNLATVLASQLGSYEAVISVKKDGYQSVSMRKDFAVIEVMSEIINASKCNADGKCEGEENAQNCPQDCL